MMIRVQVRLIERQGNALKALAQERKVSMAELIRQGVEHVIGFPEEISKEEKLRRAMRVVCKPIQLLLLPIPFSDAIRIRSYLKYIINILSFQVEIL
jgi:hypothetical protein